MRIDLGPGLSIDERENAGREWRPQGDPKEVRVHDFLIKDLGRAVPHGIYDLAAKRLSAIASSSI